jgi:hypothetical protein
MGDERFFVLVEICQGHQFPTTSGDLLMIKQTERNITIIIFTKFSEAHVHGRIMAGRACCFLAEVDALCVQQGCKVELKLLVGVARGRVTFDSTSRISREHVSKFCASHCEFVTTLNRKAAICGREWLDNIQTPITIVSSNELRSISLKILGRHELPVPTWTGCKVIHPKVDVGCGVHLARAERKQ